MVNGGDRTESLCWILGQFAFYSKLAFNSLKVQKSGPFLSIAFALPWQKLSEQQGFKRCLPLAFVSWSSNWTICHCFSILFSWTSLDVDLHLKSLKLKCANLFEWTKRHSQNIQAILSQTKIGIKFYVVPLFILPGLIVGKRILWVNWALVLNKLIVQSNPVNMYPEGAHRKCLF